MLKSLWTGIVQVINIITFSSVPDGQAPQHPLLGQPIQPTHHADPPATTTTFHEDRDTDVSYMTANGEPVVGIARIPEEPGRMDCHYPLMKGWEPCFDANDRSCWLKEIDGPDRIDVNTNYEDPEKVPKGTTREFYLEVTEQPISPDGVTMENGKVFNRSYPGPWIEACWGDTLKITVKNNLRFNGTSVHWHGFRQFESFQNDGVNGVTECPIAPGEKVTYEFRALQYGSAWYHSHYSMQYGDGMLGPITIYGPSTANFDTNAAFKPLLITDWNHRSVFQDWPLMLQTGDAPEMTNILFNGIGRYGRGHKPDKYSIYLKEQERYMLILINTAVDTTFVFSIDDHELEVIEMDFVPIDPYKTNHIKIGIGQRYHIVVQALEDPYEVEKNGNFWMRATPARKCSKFTCGPDEQMGIVRYNLTKRDLARKDKTVKEEDSLSEPPLYSIACADEPYENLKPRLSWHVGNPINIDPAWKTWNDTKKLANNTKFVFDVGMTKSRGPPYFPDDKDYTRWDMHSAPFRINFSDPTLLALDRVSKLIDQPHLNIVTPDRKRLEDKDPWVWMIITAPDKPKPNSDRTFLPAAHPMHLHGHDFALLRQSNHSFYGKGKDCKGAECEDGDCKGGDCKHLTPAKLRCNNPYIKCSNPPRRDVVLLPAGGYVVIAFKADNPGIWIIHCHIAFHASSGLAMQIIENEHLIGDIMKKDHKKIEDNCKKWRNWYGNPMNHWEYQNSSHFQDDSGV